MTVVILGQSNMIQFTVVPKARNDKSFEVRVIKIRDENMEVLSCKDLPMEPPKKKKDGA